MTDPHSVRFFDEQFRRQVVASDLALNPFEQRALPYLRGRVLDNGCGLGNLALAAARQGCSVLALDASAAAIGHLQAQAASTGLPVQALQADLRDHVIDDDFDAVVCIGLLMFFDCPTAWRQLAHLQAHVRPGGVAVVNVLVEGTTFTAMFGPEGHCLFPADDLVARFQGWDILDHRREAFEAPGDTQKVFVTVIARRPTGAGRPDGACGS